MDPHHAALDDGDVALSWVRHRPRLALGIFSSRMGRLLGMGPGRRRISDAVAHRHCVSAFCDDAGKTRHAESLERLADLYYLHAVDPGNAADAQRHHLFGARVRAIADRKLVRNFPRLDLCYLP